MLWRMRNKRQKTEVDGLGKGNQNWATGNASRDNMVVSSGTVGRIWNHEMDATRKAVELPEAIRATGFLEIIRTKQ